MKQGQLFPIHSLNNVIKNEVDDLNLSTKSLENWQSKISSYQEKLFNRSSQLNNQETLFSSKRNDILDSFNPLYLTPLSISFWRLPSCPHRGPAIYLVMDRLEKINKHILLYIGETKDADQRWKGNHDCKCYLSAYCEAINQNGMSHQLSIRFWNDVPLNTPKRRKIEQKLIQKWLPPFNKETRNHWNTPFTSLIHKKIY